LCRTDEPRSQPMLRCSMDRWDCATQSVSAGISTALRLPVS
jgi:hypothetical protein